MIYVAYTELIQNFLKSVPIERKREGAREGENENE